ncbi:MAG: DUF2293 domain-containing protein [Frankiaceae bacterium]
MGRVPIDLERRVTGAAEAALTRHESVSPVDVITGIGWLQQTKIDDWRRGSIACLEQVAAVDPAKLGTALNLFRSWAKSTGLRPGEVANVAARRDRRPLRFTADGDPAMEQAWRTHWISAEMPEAKRERLTQRSGQAPDLVVVSPLKDWTCAGCEGTDSLLYMEDGGPLCLTCADMNHLVFLSAGEAALTRRAKSASGLSAIVVRYSRSRRRYERQGVLVEEAALRRAERQCLGDEDARQRRRERDRERRANEDVALQRLMAERIVELFPGCPVRRAEVIASHTGARGSGRVGRSAAGRALDDEAIRRAVIAAVRHEDTDYDELLMSGVPRAEARGRVRADVDRVLGGWLRRP